MAEAHPLRPTVYSVPDTLLGAANARFRYKVSGNKCCEAEGTHLVRRTGFVVAALTGLAVVVVCIHLHPLAKDDLGRAELKQLASPNSVDARVIEATRYARDWRVQLDQSNAIILAEKIPGSWVTLLERHLVVQPADTEWAKAASDRDAVWIDSSAANRIEPGILRNLLKEGKYLYFYGEGANAAISRHIGLHLPFREEYDEQCKQVGWGVRLVHSPNVYHTSAVFSLAEPDATEVLSAMVQQTSIALSEYGKGLNSAGSDVDSDWPLEHSTCYMWHFGPCGRFTLVKKIYHDHSETDSSADYWVTENNCITGAGYAVCGTRWEVERLCIEDAVEPGSDGSSLRVGAADPQSTAESCLATVPAGGRFTTRPGWCFPTYETSIVNRSSMPYSGYWEVAYRLGSQAARGVHLTCPGVEVAVRPEGGEFGHRLRFTVRFTVFGLVHREYSNLVKTTLACAGP